MAEPDPKVAVPLTMRFLACIAENVRQRRASRSGSRGARLSGCPDGLQHSSRFGVSLRHVGSDPARRGLTPSGCSGEEGFEARFVLEGADCCQTQLLGCEECGCESSYVFCCHCVEARQDLGDLARLALEDRAAQPERGDRARILQAEDEPALEHVARLRQLLVGDALRGEPASTY